MSSSAALRSQTPNARDGYIGRFAPSPTGPLHFGSLLAAVGSYLQARVAGGRWLLRIEDLDRPRTVPGADTLIIDTLAAFGFEWHGPVEYQSNRLHLYAEALTRLNEAGRLYACSCSRSQIAAWHAARSPQTIPQELDELPYPGTCRGSPLKDAKTQIAIRFELPDIATVNFVDALQGSQSDDVRRTSGDFVLRRRDGIYAYHLAVVVDDAAQGITEVVRGADLLSSTGRHILLQQALGVPTPRYCHLPLALDGRDLKLSKSSQSLAVDPKQASPLLWRALASLRQTPPPSLQAASLAEIWAWAVENWSLDPLQGLLSCPAPAAGLAITSG